MSIYNTIFSCALLYGLVSYFDPNRKRPIQQYALLVAASGLFLVWPILTGYVGGMA